MLQCSGRPWHHCERATHGECCKRAIATLISVHPPYGMCSKARQRMWGIPPGCGEDTQHTKLVYRWGVTQYSYMLRMSYLLSRPSEHTNLLQLCQACDLVGCSLAQLHCSLPPLPPLGGQLRSRSGGFRLTPLRIRLRTSLPQPMKSVAPLAAHGNGLCLLTTILLHIFFTPYHTNQLVTQDRRCRIARLGDGQQCVTRSPVSGAASSRRARRRCGRCWRVSGTPAAAAGSAGRPDRAAAAAAAAQAPLAACGR